MPMPNNCFIILYKKFIEHHIQFTHLSKILLTSRKMSNLNNTRIFFPNVFLLMNLTIATNVYPEVFAYAQQLLYHSVSLGLVQFSGLRLPTTCLGGCWLGEKAAAGRQGSWARQTTKFKCTGRCYFIFFLSVGK